MIRIRVTGDAVTKIIRLKADDGGPMDIGGGTRFFTALDNWVNLNLVETRTFPDGVVMTGYETQR